MVRDGNRDEEDDKDDRSSQHGRQLRVAGGVVAREDQDLLQRRAHGDEEGNHAVAERSAGDNHRGDHHGLHFWRLFLAGGFPDRTGHRFHVPLPGTQLIESEQKVWEMKQLMQDEEKNASATPPAGTEGAEAVEAPRNPNMKWYIIH